MRRSEYSVTINNFVCITAAATINNTVGTRVRARCNSANMCTHAHSFTHARTRTRSLTHTSIDSPESINKLQPAHRDHNTLNQFPSHVCRTGSLTHQRRADWRACPPLCNIYQTQGVDKSRDFCPPESPPSARNIKGKHFR